jgi:hypothetical protein
MQNTQNHPMYNNIHEYSPDHDAQKLQQSSKVNGFLPTSAGPFRTSTGFASAFTNNTRSRHGSAIAPGAYRDATNAFSHSYPNTADVFASAGTSLSHLSSPPPPQSQANPFENIHQGRGFDYNHNTSQPNGAISKQSYGVVENHYGNPSSTGLHQLGKPGIPQHSGYPHPTSAQASYANGLHLQSQTPYGPHLQTGPALNGTTSGSSVGQSGMTGGNNAPTSANEEISTIFVVGFPEDMQVCIFSLLKKNIY